MPKSRLVTIGIVGGAILGLGSIGVLAAWSVTGFAGSAAKVNREWAAWQENGLPTTREQVYLKPAPSESEHVLKLLIKATLLSRTNGRPQPQDITGEAEMRAYLAAQADVQKLYLQASELNGYQPEANWDRASYFRFRREEGLFNANQLAAEAALIAKSDWRGAVTRIRAARRLAALLAETPTRNAHSLAIARDREALQSAARCAAQFSDNPEALRALQSTLKETDWTSQPVQIVRAEIYESLAAYRTYSNQQIIDFAEGDLEVWEPMRRRLNEGLPPGMMSRAVFGEVMAFWNEFYPRLAAEKADLRQIDADMNARLSAMQASDSIPEQIVGQTIRVELAQLADRRQEHEKEKQLINAVLQQFVNRKSEDGPDAKATP